MAGRKGRKERDLVVPMSTNFHKSFYGYLIWTNQFGEWKAHAPNHHIPEGGSERVREGVSEGVRECRREPVLHTNHTLK